jgi:hypothetical protein
VHRRHSRLLRLQEMPSKTVEAGKTFKNSCFFVQINIDLVEFIGYNTLV